MSASSFLSRVCHGLLPDSMATTVHDIDTSSSKGTYSNVKGLQTVAWGKLDFCILRACDSGRTIMLLSKIDLTLFILRLLGIATLSPLLITVVVSPKVNRHPVFFNLLCGYLIYASVTVYLWVSKHLLADSRPYPSLPFVWLEVVSRCKGCRRMTTREGSPG